MAACTVIRAFYVSMCLQIFNNDFEMQKKVSFLCLIYAYVLESLGFSPLFLKVDG